MLPYAALKAFQNRGAIGGAIQRQPLVQDMRRRLLMGALKKQLMMRSVPRQDTQVPFPTQRPPMQGIPPLQVKPRFQKDGMWALPKHTRVVPEELSQQI